MNDQEEEWAVLMRAGLDGDANAYRRFLVSVTPYLRTVARSRFRIVGAPDSEVEDVVQEVLLTIHLKRGTWAPSRPIGPWITVILQHKVIDSLRRKGRQISVPIEEVMDRLPAAPASESLAVSDIDVMLGSLNRRQQAIVRSIWLDGNSIRETADRYKMTEGAVRVALHRAVKALALLYRSQST